MGRGGHHAGVDDPSRRGSADGLEFEDVKFSERDDLAPSGSSLNVIEVITMFVSVSFMLVEE